jgi:hypothetical protein
MKFIASYRTSQQISPEDWETVTKALEIDENTTIGQIRDWYYKSERVTGARREYVKINIQLIQVDDK